MTPKQEAFCVAYILSGNATEAYKQAGYSDGMATKTAQEAASRLLKNSKVIARLSELRAPAVEMAVMTIAGHLGDLKDLRDKAMDKGKYSAAVAAEVARGKCSGFYIEKVEHSGAIGIAEQIRLAVKQ